MINLATTPIDPEAAQILGHDYAERFNALPIRRDGNVLYVAMDDAACVQTRENLAAVTRHFIEPIAADPAELRYYIQRTFGADAIHSIASQFIVEEKLQTRTADAALLAELNAAPAVRLIDTLIDAGILHRASDLHIEPFGHFLRARYRVDGVLVTHGTVDISLLPNVISRLKIMADMDISEKRLPQDGHFTLRTDAESVDFRVSTIPTINGEKAAIRLLYGGEKRINKEKLGFAPDDLQVLTRLFRQPYGAVIITGPTGSGKSTTLTAFLAELNDDKRNIVTIEDPVENPLPGVNHINVSPLVGFATALKHILRQDPDVIMIGEMRDEETARIAIQSALTGHVVLTTLHTNDAAGVIERLGDMGVAHYLTAAALNGIISQRLVRHICPHCTQPATLTDEQAFLLKIDKKTRVHEGAGCGHCHQSGYSGRFALYEYIVINKESRREIADDANSFARKIRDRQALRENALQALRAGRTSAEEIIAALHRDV
ncbi:MAG: GspE/PulE family protein [Defluviitaleaceae bacterium]|nr:GspE/PulE family protein [Defluviitaleaceae bacterium]